MNRYRVRGTIEMNWSMEIEADNENAAIEDARECAADGIGLDEPVGYPDAEECHAELLPVAALGQED